MIIFTIYLMYIMYIPCMYISCWCNRSILRPNELSKKTFKYVGFSSLLFARITITFEEAIHGYDCSLKTATRIAVPLAGINRVSTP